MTNMLKPIMITKIVFDRVIKNKNQYQYYSKFYKKQNRSKKLFHLFFYFLYKTIREYALFTTNNIITTNGYKIKTIHNDIGISEELRIFKIHEPLTTELIKNIVKEGMICIDLGSNLGYYTLLESKLVGNSGKVIAFEPSPVTYEHFKKNLEINQTTNVDHFNIALGDTNGKVKFLVSKLSNWCRVVDDSTTTFDDNVIKVPMLTLDTFSSEHQLNKIDFIRMDIEGYELKAYSGMTQVIKKFKPDLYIEIHPSLIGIEKTIEFLLQLKEDGYEIKHYTHRISDTPWIFNKKNDILETTIEELIKKLPDMLDLNFSIHVINKY